MSFTVASFNVQNLISPGLPFYRTPGLSEAEFAWKADWLSDQLLAMNADIVAFQEVFDEPALARVVELTDAKAVERRDGRYGGPLWRGAPFKPYGRDATVFAPNINSREGNPRPALALVSRYPVIDADWVQDLTDAPIATDFMQHGAGRAGEWTLTRLSRPILRVRLRAGGRNLTVFNAHLKSPAGEFPGNGGPAPERDLRDYDPVARGLGTLRATVRRMGEALALRREIASELDRGVPIIAAGDMNGLHDGASAQLLAGEPELDDYTGEEIPSGERCYTAEESEAIRARISGLRLDSAQRIYAARTGRDVFYSSVYRGRYQSLDRILLSVHFREGDPRQTARLEHLRVLNDHLNDGLAPEADYDRLASDHGAFVARIGWL